MADVWFYAQNGQQMGPVPVTELQELAQAGRLRTTDLVWKEGLPQWVQAGSIKGLFPLPAELVATAAVATGAPPAWGYGSEPARASDVFPETAGEEALRPRQRPAATGGWESLPNGAKIGIMVGALVLVIMAIAIPVLIYTGGGSAFGPDDGDKMFSGRLSSWDRHDTIRRGCPARVYTYRMKAGSTYTIRLLSNQFDTYLRLEDPFGNNVAEDDDGDAPGALLNARIVYTAMQDGTYRIVATSFMPTRGGDFQLLVTRPPPAPPSAPSLPSAPGRKVDDNLPAPSDDGPKTFSGQLTQFDPTDRARPASRQRTYSYRMKAGTTYTIRMVANSQRFDPYLRLENPFGITVAQDDDGDGFPNARILYTCPQDGSYHIVATSFDASLGHYTVTVTPNR